MNAKPGRFVVVRPFVMSGEVVGRDKVLTLDDAQLIGELVSAGKIEPADPATARRVGRNTVTWRPVSDFELRHGHGDPRWQPTNFVA